MREVQLAPFQEKHCYPAMFLYIHFAVATAELSMYLAGPAPSPEAAESRGAVSSNQSFAFFLNSLNEAVLVQRACPAKLTAAHPGERSFNACAEHTVHYMWCLVTAVAGMRVNQHG